METSNVTIEQVAIESGATPKAVKLALYLKGLAARSFTVRQASDNLRAPESKIKRICREWMIELADYEPYANRKVKPEPRGNLLVNRRGPVEPLVLT